MTEGQVFHYPPELMQLLVQTVPLICRTKDDVLLLFRGCGMPDADMLEVSKKLARDRPSVNKYSMARDLLAVLNNEGDRLLRPRRELLRRITQLEDFSTCWPDDQLKAKGLVAEVCRVVNVKDSFTRMSLEREKAQSEQSSKARAEAQEKSKRTEQLARIRSDFLLLFGERDPQRRGRRLEPVLNALFEHAGISVRESFRRTDEPTGRVVEQIDGVVQLEGHVYLVEMKWLTESVSVDDVSRHLVRVYHRSAARAIFISDTEFSTGALQICEEALQKTVVVLVSIEEIVRLLEREASLSNLLLKKIEKAILDKRPWVKLLPK